MAEDKITVLGGDLRLITAAKLFSDSFTVYSYGWGNLSKQNNIIDCTTAKEALIPSKIVLLGIPCSKDNTYLNMPLCDDIISLEYLMDTLPCETVLCGGILPEILKDRFYNHIDYSKNEFFQYQNARLTAEAAVQIAVEQTDFSLCDSNCLIIGSGRIAKALAYMLKAYNSEITVVARKVSEREFWKISAVNSIDFPEISTEIKNANIIFNTVPALILTRELLDVVKNSATIIDLASQPGGTDFSYANKIGIKVIHALALPGKTAPLSAGKIIYETVSSLLKQKEVII